MEPGGYFEAQDMALPIGCDDGTLKEDSALWTWMLLVMDGMEELGRPLKAAQQWKAIMESVGFEEVVETVYKWPTNRWPRVKLYKELGMWSLANMDQALEAATLAPLTRALGWSKEEVMVLVSKARKVLRDPTVHAYWPMSVQPLPPSLHETHIPCANNRICRHIVYGKKPGKRAPPVPSPLPAAQQQGAS